LQKKIPLLVSVIVLTTILAIPLSTRPVSGAQGLTTGSSGNLWPPHGPLVGGSSVRPNIQYTYYSDPNAEINDFIAGNLDITDWPMSFAQLNNCITSQPDWVCPPQQPNFGMFGFYFNAASSWFTATNKAGTPYWGCDFNSGPQPAFIGAGNAPAGTTYGTNCGMEFRQGLAHLFNGRDFNNAVVHGKSGSNALNPPPKWPGSTPIGAAPAGFGNAAAVNAASTATLSLTGQTVLAQCAWDQTVMVAQLTGCYGRPSNGAVQTVCNYGAYTSVGNRGLPLDNVPAATANVANTIGCSDEPGAYNISGSGLCSGPSGSLFQTCAAGNGFPAAGSPDFCAAALHMQNAGIAATLNADCSVATLTAAASGLCSHPLNIWVRSSQPRRAMGQGLEARLDALLSPACGGASVWDHSVPVCNIVCAGAAVFHELTGAGIDDWSIYTYGYTLGGPYGGDALFPLLFGQGTGSPSSSNLASNGGVSYPSNTVNPPNNASPCSEGTAGDQPSVATFVCNPTLDSMLLLQTSTLDQTKTASYTEAIYTFYGRLVIQMDTVVQGCSGAALREVGGLTNQLGFCYNNAYNILNAHKGSFTAASSKYHFGNGDSTTLRYGNATPTDQLNPFNAQSVWEFQLIGEIYDTLIAGSPVHPDQLYSWMADNYQISTDGAGNEHILIELRQDLRWHDGLTVTASDVAFSLMSLRDLGPTSGGSLFGVLNHVTVFNKTLLDLVFNGQSAFFLPDSGVIIIPGHIWECNAPNAPSVAASDCQLGAVDVNNANGALLAGQAAACSTTAGAFGPTCAATKLYTANGVFPPSDARIKETFDPVGANVLIGSGPYQCISLPGSGRPANTIGGGCIQNADGSDSGQSTGPGSRAFLTAFDNTQRADAIDAYDQYMRGSNPNWGTGSGFRAQSGQLQEFQYSDNNLDAQINVLDFTAVSGCDGAGPTGTGTCPVASYNYWHRAAFDTGTISTNEVSLVASHLDDTFTSNFAWVNGPPPALTNVDSYAPPYPGPCPVPGSDDPTICG